MNFKILIAIALEVFIGDLVKLFFGDAYGYAIGICAGVLLGRWVENEKK